MTEKIQKKFDTGENNLQYGMLIIDFFSKLFKFPNSLPTNSYALLVMKQ